LTENPLRLRDRPLVPFRVGMRAVPKPSEGSDLIEWNGFSVWKPMAVAPIPNFFRRAESQYHRAMLMYVVPGSGRRNRKVYPKFTKSDGLPLSDRDGQWLCFATQSSVDSRFTTD
jgi:hypothetical protein